ncbi:hypothetical protein Acr_00g0062580 [Actinidia rufa]|uniref:Uncharacterized protein n=1 Tax=Actinidia rufa TaxID=165716 RepID=A0A7J0DPI5_9ERIC|nr:hypothetical protein Acr_00g0062580 [Actinidia rufa]
MVKEFFSTLFRLLRRRTLDATLSFDDQMISLSLPPHSVSSLSYKPPLISNLKPLYIHCHKKKPNQDAPFAVAIDACILNSLGFPIALGPDDELGDSVIDSTNARFALHRTKSQSRTETLLRYNGCGRCGGYGTGHERTRSNPAIEMTLTHVTHRSSNLLKPLSAPVLLWTFSTDTITVETSVPFTGHNCSPPPLTVVTTPVELMSFRDMAMMQRMEIASWVLAWLDTGKQRFVVYSVVYLAPFFEVSISPIIIVKLKFDLKSFCASRVLICFSMWSRLCLVLGKLRERIEAMVVRRCVGVLRRHSSNGHVIPAVAMSSNSGCGVRRGCGDGFGGRWERWTEESAILTIEERDPGRPWIVRPLSSNAMDCMGEREGKNDGREKGSKNGQMNVKDDLFMDVISCGRVLLRL